MNIKYQLVPPSNHRAYNAEIVIQTFKKHFIAGLCSIEKCFHLQLWYRLLQQATISLNLFRQSRTFPHISAYTHIFGEFDFNRTPLSPPGTIVVIHNRSNGRASWAPHGEGGWYIGAVMENYRCHKEYIPNTKAEIISDRVEFFPKNNNMPQMSSMDATYHAAQYLIYALHNTSPSIPLVKLGNKKKE